jgi:hypothetical protein
MSNSRKESRKKLMAFTPVYDLNRKTLLGYVGDLTLKGAMVIGEKSAEIDTNLVLGIEFPEAPPTMTTTRIVISSRVAWCRQDNEDAQYFNIGFEFIDISTENLTIIEAVLERYQFRHAMSAPGR